MRILSLPDNSLAGLRRNVRRGMTLMEMVIAILIILIIMTGVVWAFIELLQSHDKARARMDATANARAAMEVLSVEVKRGAQHHGNSDGFYG